MTGGMTEVGEGLVLEAGMTSEIADAIAVLAVTGVAGRPEPKTVLQHSSVAHAQMTCK